MCLFVVYVFVCLCVCLFTVQGQEEVIGAGHRDHAHLCRVSRQHSQERGNYDGRGRHGKTETARVFVVYQLSM